MEPNSSSNDNNKMQLQHHSSCLEIAAMEVHRVVPPPHKSTIEKLKRRLKETFFPDDPLRQFKGQPLGKKWILAAQYIFPILEWGPNYSFKLFKSDIISGLTIASLAIPQDSSFVPPLVYTVLGSSRDLAVGPVSIASLIMGSMLRQEVSPTQNPVLFLQLAFTATFFGGLVQASLGLLRLGFIIDFLSKATLIGFMAGAAIIVSLQQLKSLLGITHFTNQMGLVPVMSSVFHNTKEEGIAVGRTFAALKNYQVDGNKEMIAIGVMNIVGSSTSCYITTGAFSRSAVNHNAGAKTAVSNVVMSVTVMVTLLFLMPLFQYTPNVVLGAIIVTAVVGLIDVPAAHQIWKIDKFDFLVMLCAFLGVVFISVQEGLAIAVGISIFKILLQITRPKTVMLGNMPGSDIYRDLHHYNEAIRIPGFLILSIEAPINFANTTYLNERILRWIEEYEAEENLNKQSSLRFVILEMSAVSAIDTSGTSFFKDLRKAMEKKGVELVLVNPLAEVLEKLQRSDDSGDFKRPDSLYLTVGEAVASLSSTIKAPSANYV
ncbi:putative sulfate transporter 3.3 [Citrus sinensis]|nr:putative sulfate transporter 3.3 [Citrus sinensis]